jgi:hypothetical protein
MALGEIEVSTRIMQEKIKSFSTDIPENDGPHRFLPNSRKTEKAEKNIEIFGDWYVHSIY